MERIDNQAGGYRFLTGIPPYSSGVAAMAGHEVVHVTFVRPPPWREGFAVIDRHLAAEGRPRQALCATALRSPEPMTYQGFGEFNAGYIALLAEWEILLGDHNPVARTNVVPVVGPPSEATLYSFAYTVPADAAAASFVVAGAGDIVRQSLDSHSIVREGETSAEAMAEKASHVMAVMGARLDGLGFEGADVTHVNVYCSHSLLPHMPDTLLRPLGAGAAHGVNWHYSHPPIAGLAFEMDMRGVNRSIWLGA